MQNQISPFLKIIRRKSGYKLVEDTTFGQAVYDILSPNDIVLSEHRELVKSLLDWNFIHGGH